MVESDIHSSEFQTQFRENLKNSFPQAWETLRILEANGLMVQGYTTLPGNEIILNAGVPPQEGQEFVPAFLLRSTILRGIITWRFGAIAHTDSLPEDLQIWFSQR